MKICSSVTSGCTRPGSMPVSSLASRSAVATGPSSSGSAAPPGNAAWPAWWRRVEARTVTSRSASSGRPPVARSADRRTAPAPRHRVWCRSGSALALAAVIIASTSAGSRLPVGVGHVSTLSTSGRSQGGAASGLERDRRVALNPALLSSSADLPVAASRRRRSRRRWRTTAAGSRQRYRPSQYHRRRHHVGHPQRRGDVPAAVLQRGQSHAQFGKPQQPAVSFSSWCTVTTITPGPTRR